ncbi:hypothetical protein G7046_g8995 [Stylonectria norvegica]|nr:hypothetical protein G7046_g8995 [Stylonectria norvegica]
MKFVLSLLLAAPAVMGRACRAHRHSSKVVSASAQNQVSTAAVSSIAALSSTFFSQPTASVSVIPELGVGAPAVKSSSTASIVVTTSSSAVPTTVVTPTTLVTSAAPVSTSASASASAEPTADAASGSVSSSGSTELSSTAVSGSSTFYGGNLSGGACSFSTYTIPSGLYGTAFSGQPWDSAANCGACIEITGPSGTITAMIVDECPECTTGHLDLFPDAFTAVGGTDGIVSTSYKFVACGITSPITLHNKSGTSQYWFSMQVVNANEPVKSLEVSIDGGSTWAATTRKDYNFFENPSGFGTSTVDVRVTSTTGKTITMKNVGVTSDSQIKGSSNF